MKVGNNYFHFHLLGVGAVVIQGVELRTGNEFAPVDPGLNRTQAPQDSNLFDIAHDGCDLQPLEFGVDGVKSTHQVFEKQFERLRKTNELSGVDHESGDFGTSVVDQLTDVMLRVARNGRRRAVGRGFESWFGRLDEVERVEAGKRESTRSGRVVLL